MYEYLTENINNIDNLNKWLNEKAKDGWEYDTPMGQNIILKRRIPMKPGPKKRKEILK